MTHETNEPEKNDQRATQGLDPDRVDDRCEVVEVPVPGKRPVIVSLRSVVPLTEREQRLLGELVEIVAAHEERDNPHGGVVTELMLAWNAGRGWIKDGPTRDRLGAAIRSATAVVRAAGADRDSRFRWAEEAAHLDAELDAERLAHAGTQGERDAGDDFAKGVRGWLDVPDEPGWGLDVRDRIAELRADATSDASLDYVRTSLVEHMDLASELSLPDVLAAACSVVDERDAARAERGVYLDSAVAYAAQVAELKAELAGLRERAGEVEKYWRDWSSERRAKVHALSQFLAGAIEDLAVAVESWRPGHAPTKPGRSLERDPDVPSSVEAAEREWHVCHNAGSHHITDTFHGNDCDRPEHWDARQLANRIEQGDGK